MSDSADARQIQQRMGEVRDEMEADVEKIVENAMVMTDWRFYIRTYPWVCLGVGAAVGYLIIPRRLELIHPSVATLMELARKNQLVVTPQSQAEARPRGGPATTLLTILAHAVVRGAMGYVTANANRLWSGQIMPQGRERNGRSQGMDRPGV